MILYGLTNKITFCGKEFVFLVLADPLYHITFYIAIYNIHFTSKSIFILQSLELIVNVNWKLLFNNFVAIYFIALQLQLAFYFY